MKKENIYVTFEIDSSRCLEIEKKLLKLVDYIDFESYESNLLDNYLFYVNGRTIEEFSDYPTTNYIILEEKYVNCYTSTYTVTLTNNEKIASYFERRAIKYWNKIENDEREYQLI